MSLINGAEAFSGVSDVQHLPERRCCARAKVSEMGGVTAVELGVQTGLLLDLSAGGIAVQAVYPPETRESFSVQFHLPFSEEIIEATCEVAWVDDARQTGLKFIELADKPKHSLNAWLGAHGRASDTALDSEDVAAFLQHCEGSGRSHLSVNIPDPRPGSAFTAINPEEEALLKVDRENAAMETSPPERDLINADMSLVRVLKRIVERARSLTAAGGAAIVLRDKQDIVCKASTGDAPDVGSRLPSGSSLTGDCFRTGEVVLCNDTDPRVRPSHANLFHFRSILIVPIQRQGSILGVIEVFSSQPSAFNGTHIATLQSIADLLAFVLGSATEVDRGRQETAFAEAQAQQALDSVAKSIDSFKQTPPEVLVTDHWSAVGKLRVAIANSAKNRRPESVRYAVLAPIGVLLVGAFALLATAPHRKTNPPLAQEGVTGEQQSATQQPGGVQNKTTIKEVEHRSVTKHETPLPVPPKLLRSLSMASKTSEIPFKSLGGSSPEPAHLRSLSIDDNAEQKPTILALPSRAVTAPVLGPGGPLQSFLVNAVPISQPPPVYPAPALRMGVEGSVTLQGTVGTDGRVRNLRPVRGHALLTQVAIEAVKNWKYQPALLNGIPVETEITVNVNFRR